MDRKQDASRENAAEKNIDFLRKKMQNYIRLIVIQFGLFFVCSGYTEYYIGPDLVFNEHEQDDYPIRPNGIQYDGSYVEPSFFDFYDLPTIHIEAEYAKPIPVIQQTILATLSTITTENTYNLTTKSPHETKIFSYLTTVVSGPTTTASTTTTTTNQSIKNTTQSSLKTSNSLQNTSSMPVTAKNASNENGLVPSNMTRLHARRGLLPTGSNSSESNSTDNNGFKPAFEHNNNNNNKLPRYDQRLANTWFENKDMYRILIIGSIVIVCTILIAFAALAYVIFHQ
jgi:hypothetical protein